MKLYDGGHSVDVNGAPASSGGTPLGDVVIYDEGATVEVIASAPPIINPPVLIGQAIDFVGVVLLSDWIGRAGIGSYHRFTFTLCATKDGPYEFIRTGYNSNGAQKPFLHPRYKLMLWPVDAATGREGSPVVCATRDVGATETKPVFNATFPLPDGLYILQILPFTLANDPITPVPGECYPRIPFWVDKGGTAKSFPWYAQTYGDYEWTHPPLQGYTGPAWHFYSIKPASSHKPQAYPLPLDTAPYTPFSTLEKARLYRINLTPAQEQGVDWYPCVTDRGIKITEGYQGYFASGYTAFQPYMPYIDGERGVAQTAHTLYVSPGRNNKVYFNTPYSWRRCDADGKVRTLIGIRHKYAPYHADVMAYSAKNPPQLHPSVEIVGNFIGFPLNESFPLRPWFSFWDPVTILPDVNAPPVQDATMAFPETPHLETPPTKGPIGIIGDSHGYVLSAEFDGANHLTPADVIRLFAITDPFGGAEKDGILYVASRSMNRIEMWDYRARPAKFLGNLCAAPAGLLGGTIDGRHRYFPALNGVNITQAQARAYTQFPTNFIPGPEGLAIMDNVLYVGSSSCGQILAIDLATKAITPACPVTAVSGQTVGFMLSASDGTVGPRHTLFECTFDNVNQGHARAHIPVSGVGTDGVTYTHSKLWDWTDLAYDASQGAGGKTLDGVYPMAIHAGNGAIIEGGSEQTIRVWRLAKPTELAPDYAKLQRGHAAWHAAGYNAEYGRLGYGTHPDAQLPWGVNADLDYWLQQSGHVKATA